MKKTSPLLLALALLAGCAAPAPEGPEPLPDEPPAEAGTPSLPEPRQLEPISAPAVVTEGRAPAEDYDLPPLPRDTDWRTYRNNAERWVTDGPSIAVLAEDREADAVLYGLPLYADTSQETALIRWGDCLAEFDWTLFPGPSMALPQIKGLDTGLGVEELAVICQVGTGTGVSIAELHILEKGPDGTLTAHTFPESLWQEELPKLFDTAELNGRTFAILGHELVEFQHEGSELDLESASFGMIADFETTDWGGLRFRGAFCLSPPDSAAPCYVAETSAEVLLEDGVFILQDLHLYSYHQ
ncbi:hypothetical protein [uncultured Oscillibacter sp.]|uniref:hypothetical protein n=1 Tax=uncultured Oscillibacter sp. TaxID=876091 RepID=UPI0025F4E761|nr:hypothetical protein [uncultured Oscillibacter sp.]